MSNAVKYLKPHEKQHQIDVKIEITENKAVIHLADNGVGIDSEHIEHIFKLFFRTNDSSNTEGSGIGLYIVKEAITKMNGKISVYSTPQRGTSFEIVIPNKK